MIPNKITEYFETNRQYRTALLTDCLFPCRFLPRDIEGIVGQAARYIEQEQLTDPALWASFVAVFSGKADAADNGWRGEFWGKMMRGACMTYLYTRNESLYALLRQTAEDMLATQDEYGRFSTYTRETEYHGWDLWSRKYIGLGFLHFMEICPDKDFRDRIRAALMRHFDRILSEVNETGVSVQDTSDFWGGANSVSMLEPVMRLYNETGEPRYLAYAEYLIKTGPKDWNIFQKALENTLPPYRWPLIKAYEIMSCFEGYLEYYRATGKEEAKQAVIRFADQILTTEVTVIGCCGCKDEQFNHAARTQTDPTNRGYMQETCVTVTWMKLLYQLLRLTGDVRYADAIEQSAFNALYGALNTEHQTVRGRVLPFDSYSPLLKNIRGREVAGHQFDADKKVIYGCCAAIGAAGTALVPEFAVMLFGDGVVVNTYQSGRYDLLTPSGDPLTLTVETRYPAAGDVTLRLTLPTPETFSLRLRIPSFAENSTLTVNGDTAAAAPGYHDITRRWQDGDTVLLSLDMAPRVQRAVGCDVAGSENYAAVFYGPLALAREARLGDMTSVDLAVGKDGRIPLVPSKTAPFETLCEFTAPCRDGASVVLVDYAHAGKIYNETAAVEVWLPTV